jgi:hypothetical protein
MQKPFDTSSVDTIVSGARLLATAQDLDPDKLETIVRKAASVARENLMQTIHNAND